MCITSERQKTSSTCAYSMLVAQLFNFGFEVKMAEWTRARADGHAQLMHCGLLKTSGHVCKMTKCCAEECFG